MGITAAGRLIPSNRSERERSANESGNFSGTLRADSGTSLPIRGRRTGIERRAPKMAPTVLLFVLPLDCFPDVSCACCGQRTRQKPHILPALVVPGERFELPTNGLQEPLRSCEKSNQHLDPSLTGAPINDLLANVLRASVRGEQKSPVSVRDTPAELGLFRMNVAARARRANRHDLIVLVELDEGRAVIPHGPSE